MCDLQEEDVGVQPYVTWQQTFDPLLTHPVSRMSTSRHYAHTRPLPPDRAETRISESHASITSHGKLCIHRLTRGGLMRLTKCST